MLGFTRKFVGITSRRLGNKFNFSAHGHDHHKPSIPVFHDRLGKGILILTYLWIMYRFKEDNGKMFGYNLPWDAPHDDHHGEEH